MIIPATILLSKTYLEHIFAMDALFIFATFFNSFKNSLDLNKKKYAVISGNFQKRKEMAIDLINNLLNLQ